MSDSGTVRLPLPAARTGAAPAQRRRVWRNSPLLRKACILLVLACVWQIYAVQLDKPLLFPTLTDTLQALWSSLASGALFTRIGFTLRTLLMGYAAGILLAGVVTALAVGSRLGNDLLETFTAMFNPLPAIALLPLSLLWFGLGNGSLIFVLVHSVLWPTALSTHAGFRAVSPTLRMVGRNYGLTGLRLVLRILVPAAFPSILTGLKNGWAFAWRTLIAAELVFGVSSGAGGLGWFIYENKNQLEIPSVFAGLLTVILIGLFVENLIFRTIERRTVRRWGMQA
ncbi:MAG: ABC transporter permease [Candidatus Dactylopiibacterium sp.]|nr:ABC transporter permease [Candidatus Dactylopiibacterium sp.]